MAESQRQFVMRQEGTETRYDVRCATFAAVRYRNRCVVEFIVTWETFSGRCILPRSVERKPTRQRRQEMPANSTTLNHHPNSLPNSVTTEQPRAHVFASLIVPPTPSLIASIPA